MIIRVILLICWIVTLVLFVFIENENQQVKYTLGSITYQLALIDVMIIVMIYVVGFAAIFKNKKLKTII